jgi:hypothetical protein
VEHLHAAAGRAAHPATLLAGPQVSLALLLTAGFAGSAFTMFTVLPRWDVSVPAAGLGVAVVGLYMSPPEHALVLAVDQKSPIDAPDYATRKTPAIKDWLVKPPQVDQWGQRARGSLLEPRLPGLQIEGEPGYPVGVVIAVGPSAAVEMPEPVIVGPEEVGQTSAPSAGSGTNSHSKSRFSPLSQTPLTTIRYPSATSRHRNSRAGRIRTGDLRDPNAAR